VGAYDYLQKPFDVKELSEFVERVIESIASRKNRAQKEHETKIITENPTYLGVLRMASELQILP